MQLSSKQFSEYIFERTQDLTFFVGGPDGHPQVIQKESKSILSLSNLTLTHEMALLVLTEQIFRAISIKGWKNVALFFTASRGISANDFWNY